MRPMIDCSELQEEDRIDLIVGMLNQGGHPTVLLDEDEPKIKRYMKKIVDLCPSAYIVERTTDSVDGIVSLKLSKKLS